MDTIFAEATARGRAGVSVIRVSGPAAGAVAERLCGSVPPPRRPVLRRLRDADGQAIDEALVLLFPEGASFTGEDVVEFQVHGSPAVIAALLREIGQVPGTRLAEPGEFTRRALENDRMDIAQVEGLGDLIDAETELQRRQALRLLSGGMAELVDRLRDQLVRAAALIEATIDFADEEVPVDVSPEVLGLLTAVRQDIENEIAGSRASEIIRDGFEVALVGSPNAGKSTLLNALAGRDAAITSEIAGTTRDVIEVRMDIDGLAITLLDLAGVRETEDVVERIGVDRARKRAAQADLRVFLLDIGETAPVLDPEPDDLIVRGKADLQPGEGLAVSGATGAGIPDLLDTIRARAETRLVGGATATRLRHRMALEQSLNYILSAEAQIDSADDRSEIAAEELRRAISALEALVGRVDVEQVLDVIFSSFCIGK